MCPPNYFLTVFTKLHFLAVGCDNFGSGPARGRQRMVPGGVIGADIVSVDSVTLTLSLSFRILHFENVPGNL